MNVFSQTFNAVQQSWKILMADKELIVFPILSGILCLLVSASFYFPMLTLGEFSITGIVTSPSPLPVEI